MHAMVILFTLLLAISAVYAQYGVGVRVRTIGRNVQQEYDERYVPQSNGIYGSVNTGYGNYGGGGYGGNYGGYGPNERYGRRYGRYNDYGRYGYGGYRRPNYGRYGRYPTDYGSRKNGEYETGVGLRFQG